MAVNYNARFNAVKALITALKQETESAAITPRSLGSVLDEIVALMWDCLEGKALGPVDGNLTTHEPTTPTPAPVLPDAPYDDETTTSTTEEPTTTTEEPMTTPEPSFEDGYSVYRFNKPIYNIRLSGYTEMASPFYFVENDTLFINFAANAACSVGIEVIFLDGTSLYFDCWAEAMATREPMEYEELATTTQQPTTTMMITTTQELTTTTQEMTTTTPEPTTTTAEPTTTTTAPRSY